MNINPWKSSSVRTALEGRSFIDSSRIHIHSLEEAEKFIECYGFKLNDEADRQELESLRREALALIEEELLEADEAIPDAVISELDIRKLLLYASGHGPRGAGPWSGALLRVLHTLVHSHSPMDEIYHDTIREQIFSRFEPHVTQTAEGNLLGDIPLTSFEFRKAKSRRSVAMKLMHKAENVAADIFDWIGIRFVTEYRADVLNVLAFLRTHHIVTYANLKPSRSRNTLIDLEWIDSCLAKGMNTDEIREKMQHLDYPSAEMTRSENPYSELSYHSVQITCRQRIKIEQAGGSKLCFYFPFEIQIMDRDSFLQTREGLASHAEYKNRQRAVVRKRILPFLPN